MCGVTPDAVTLAYSVNVTGVVAADTVDGELYRIRHAETRLEGNEPVPEL